MMKRYRRTALSQYLVVGLILLIFVGFGLISNFAMTQFQFEDHFVVPWAAGRLWLLEGQNPYSPDIIAFAEEQVENSEYLAILPQDQGLKIPLVNLIFYLPFSLVPYSFSRTIWVTGMVLIIGVIGYLSIRLSEWKLSTLEYVGGILLTILWFPSVSAILTGQLSPVIVFFLLMGAYLIRRNEDTPAGFLLSLTFSALTSNIFLMIFFVVYSILHRRWSILSAYFSGAAFLIIVSILMLPSWPMDWAGAIVDQFVNFQWLQTPLFRLSATLPGITTFLSLTLHVIFILYYLSILISNPGKSNLVILWKINMILAISFLMHIQATIHHALLLIPAIFLIFRFSSDRWSSWGRIVSWMVLLTITIGSWFTLYQEIGFLVTEAMPIIAVILALFVFVAMLWSRWWGLIIPKLSIK